MADDDHSKTYAIVGELVLISSALDHELNKVVAAVLHLGESPLLLPVIATLDAPRKIEMLRARVSHIPPTAASWRHALLQFLDHVETVNKHRNIACHTPLALEDGKWVVKPTAAAKLLKQIDLNAKKLKPGAVVLDFKKAIEIGEHALGEALTLLSNLKRIEEERARREEAKAKK